MGGGAPHAPGVACVPSAVDLGGDLCEQAADCAPAPGCEVLGGRRCVGPGQGRPPTRTGADWLEPRGRERSAPPRRRGPPVRGRAALLGPEAGSEWKGREARAGWESAAGGGRAASPKAEGGPREARGADPLAAGAAPPARSHSVSPRGRHGSCARPPGTHTCLSRAANPGPGGQLGAGECGRGWGALSDAGERGAGRSGTKGRCARGRVTSPRPPLELEGWDPQPEGALRRLQGCRAPGFTQCCPWSGWGKTVLKLLSWVPGASRERAGSGQAL
ncbi:PREDICTED: uncharacterized protein LOC109383242 [Hipposideros armiger]|uniref:Uncharacterized protein LOC109383242 n=1 Tax=Hipposideros armiger TaxID=186990 RepID=A0A8B7RD83_HIPAR|nr:PREDICTED: uncharacterized protein LOC109383242 [Hipposideros armiger]